MAAESWQDRPPFTFALLTRAWARPCLTRNVVLNWLSTGVTIASTLVLTPIVVRTLDKELYGIWSFLNGLLAYSDLLYLGLGAALVKQAAEYFARRDLQRLNRLCSVVLSIYVVAGALSVALATGMASFLPLVFANGLDPATAASARDTCVLLGFRLLSLFACSMYSGALVAADRTDIARLMTITFTVVRLVLVPFVLLARSPLVALALLAATTAAGETFLTAWAVGRVIPGLRPRFVLPRLSELRPLYGFGLQSFFVLMAVKLISYTDQTVIGVTLGAASVALYTLPLQLIEYGRLLINGLVAVLLPRLAVLHMNDDSAALGRAYLDASRVAAAVAAFLNAQVAMLGVPFLERWVGHDFGQSAQVILVCLGSASILQAISTQVPLPFFQTIGYLRVPALVLLAEGAANLALSLALIPRFGLDGVAMGTLIPSFCVSFLIVPAYLCRKLHVSPARFMMHGIAPAVAVGAMTLAVLAALNAVTSATAYHVLAAKAAITAAIVAAAVLLTSPSGRRTVLAFMRPGDRTRLSSVALRVEEESWKPL